MNVIELKGITKSYGEGNSRVEVLRDVNLSIRQGDFVAIIGQSGSGKSTLMNILGCLDTPTAGSYAVYGKEAASLGPDGLAALRSEKFGFVFQRYNLLGLPERHGKRGVARRLRGHGPGGANPAGAGDS